MFRYKSKNFNKWLILSVFLGVMLIPGLANGRVNELAIEWNTTIGHDHDGIDGKKTTASDVINVPAGDIAATNTQAAITELDSEKINVSEIGVANGVPSLDASIKILAIQLPAIAITDVSVCASQVCQLALTAEEGDVCVRSDENKSYIHNGGIVGDMTDWTQLLATGIVTSIQSQTGDVSLSHVDLDNIGVSDHHNNLSNLLNITPTTVTTTGDIKINSNAISSELLFGTAGDVNLYRGGSNTLSTDDAFSAISFSAVDGFFNSTNGLSTDTSYESSVTGDSVGRFVIDGDGALAWGDGSAVRDTNLYRSGANILQTDDNFISRGNISSLPAGASEWALTARVFTGTSYDWGVQADGVMFWSDGVGGAYDTNLKRGGVNLLKTDDGFEAASLNSVGVGTTITYAATSRVVVLSSVSFQDDSSASWSTTVGSSGSSKTTTSVTAVHAGADIVIEDGVTITSLIVHGITAAGSASNSIIGTLYRNAFNAGPGSGTEVAACTMANGSLTCTDNTITNPVVDQATYKYTVDIRGLWATGTATQLFTVLVTYTSVNATQ